jgi:hypothetical protein
VVLALIDPSRILMPSELSNNSFVPPSLARGVACLIGWPGSSMACAYLEIGCRVAGSSLRGSPQTTKTASPIS